ncbi:MAG: hypothetical protein Q8M16_13255 [Pirellulaceae bacterium]|nr:hypothetical protein [Pirellulaceae bacterium]
MSVQTTSWVATTVPVLLLYFFNSPANANLHQEVENSPPIQDIAQAQVQDTGNDESVVEDRMELAPGRKRFVVAKRLYLRQVFQVEVELIQRLCSPTPQQLAKLRIASKGAAEKIANEWARKQGHLRPVKQSDEREQVVEQASVEVDEGETYDLTKIDEEEAAASIQLMAEELMEEPFNVKRPQHEATWTTFLAGILTAEQSQIMTDHKSKQDHQRRKVLLDLFVGTVSLELSLSDDQQLKLRGILQPHFIDIPSNSTPMFDPYVSYYLASKVTNEELSQVLSPGQIQLLRILLHPAKEIGEMLEMNEDDE